MAVDTYKIQIEDIRKLPAPTDQSTKDVAAQVLQLVRVARNIYSKLESAKRTKEAGKIDVPAIGLAVRRVDALERTMSVLDTKIKQLDLSLSKLPNEIKKAVSSGKETVKVVKEVVKTDPGEARLSKEILAQLKSIARSYERVQKSETYKTGQADVLKLLEATAKQLTSQQKSIDELNKTIAGLSKAIGSPGITKGIAPTAAVEHKLVEGPKLLGKSLEDLGVEFEKIKRRLEGKIVVTVDLETSAGKFGKDAAAEFITQIGYQKGTLEQIMAGVAKKGEIFIKPPAKTEQEYIQKAIKGASDPEALKKILIPFEKLQREGIDAFEAMHKFAEILKDAEAVIGHNIAGFDISVLQQHFEKAGVQIDVAVDKFVDTLQASRAAFPERKELGKRLGVKTPFALGQIEKDFEAGGVIISKGARQLGKELHNASRDVEILEALLRALSGDTEELAAMQSFLSATLQQVAKNIQATTQDFDLKKMQKAVDEATVSMEDLYDEELDTIASLKKAKQSIERTTINVEDLARVRSGLQAAVYKEAVIRPQPTGPLDIAGKAAGVPGIERMSGVLGDLAGSLDRLQNNIVFSLEKGMRSGMQILREGGKAFRLAPGGREFELKVADVRSITKALAGLGVYSPQGMSAEALVDEFKRTFVQRGMGTLPTPEGMASDIFAELGSMNEEAASRMGKVVQNLFEGIKKQTVTIKDIAQNKELVALFKSVSLETKAQRELEENYIKRIAIPAAKITETGVPAFGTKYGAERVLANFATITTGLEKLVNEMRELGAPAMEVERFIARVAEIPIRPKAGLPATEDAKILAEELINKVSQLGGRTTLKRGYERAIGLRTRDLEGPGAAKIFLQDPDKKLADLIAEADKLGIKALEVATALDEINFENFYDVLDRLFQAGKTPFLEAQAGKLGKFDESTLRKISSVVNELLGLMPVGEPGRPARKAYEEESVKVLTKAVGGLKPEEQKKHIIDVTLLWKDLVDKSKKLGETGLFQGKAYLGHPMATGLDLSDAASSQLKQFNMQLGSNLKSLDKTMVAMSTAGVRGRVPFEQFGSLARQMSYITRGMVGGLPGEKLETPALTSARERALIESGKYGAGGYGLNVLTELRNTAGTFEDQIMISGRLANAFTKIVSKVRGPAATLLEARGITEVKPGFKKVSPKGEDLLFLEKSHEEFNSALKTVTNELQTIFGVSKKYQGRADIAEIGTNIENVLREHRGETIEVQIAKLTETFMNYFGRKFATRFGTKGVSVTTGGLPSNIQDEADVAELLKAGFKGKIATGVGLGVAKMPKSIGQLLSELFEDVLGEPGPAGRKLNQTLIESGNKFIIEMFRDAEAGLVTKEEAAKQAKLFADVVEGYKKVFAAELPSGISGIKEIKEVYTERFGKEELYELKPIEARISARGIAKRGLMPEVLEGIVNNLIGTTAGTTTLVDKIGREALTETEGARKRLNEYLSELGFGAFKDLGSITERLELETPGIDPKIVDELKEWEKQWHVYTNVIDEFGKEIQSFVAPKFLQIIEEPHFFKEWGPREIEKGLKGAKFDFQSFAAMAGVFGEGSSMMKELSSQTTVASHAGWELIKAFQMLDPTMKSMKDTLMAGLRTVKLGDIAAFKGSVGTLEDFKDTLLDIAKFPTAFKLAIPTTRPGAAKAHEELYVPGPSLRATYEEPLMGKRAPTGIARRLTNLVEAAQQVEELRESAARGGVGLSEEFQRKFANTIRGELTKTLTDLIKRFRDIEKAGPTPQNIQFMEQTIEKFKSALTTRGAPSVYQEVGGATEIASLEAYARKTGGPTKYANILGRISDLIIGASPESLRQDEERIRAAIKSYEERGEAVPTKYQGYLRRNRLRREAPTIFDLELEAGNLDEFTKKVGISLQRTVEEALQVRTEALSRAKVMYFKTLGEEVIGKKKGIEQAFFQRITPAITGKAVSAITDKTKELKELLDTLTGAKYDLKIDIPDLDDMIRSLRTLNEEHGKYIKKSKELGLPVLKESEIGLPAAMAAKVKVRTGKEGEIETNLAELIRKQEEVFVESIRYPFTGTLSIQPHIAKLMEDITSESTGKFAIAVPGAPQLDLAELNKIVTTLREYIGLVPEKEGRVYFKGESLIEKREQEWGKGTEEGAQKAVELTSTMEGLIKVVNAAIPKYLDMEQKLDFDGDALFVHTGQLEKSRAEIKKHFEALGDDITSVRNLFRTVFTAVRESEVSTLAEMSYRFGKRHPKEKGFEFLTKPYVEEQMEQLNMEEVLKGLFAYEAPAELEAGTKKWSDAFNAWAKKSVADTLETEVFERLNVGAARRGEALEQVRGSKFGMPEEAGALESNINDLTDELIRRQLWEKRYSDAIAGQLYKLHTGQTVEGISRIARISEIETGFGAGLAGTGQTEFMPSEEFLQRWPKKSIALGAKPGGMAGKPVQEFTTRVNEILRFVIQKGMDVKHAGVEAVGKQIIANVGKASGAQMIRDAMNEASDQFEELLDFEKQIGNEARLRLGALPTEELRGELKRFQAGEMTYEEINKELENYGRQLVGDAPREAIVDAIVEEAKKIDLGKNRAEIVNEIIGYINLDAVFEELFRQIKRTAIRGLAKQLRTQLEEMPAGPEKSKLIADIGRTSGGVERYAAEQISREAAGKAGISTLRRITTPLQPLYKLRTGMETMATAAGRTKLEFEPEKMFLPEGMEGKGLSKEFEIARKAAHTMTRSLMESVKEPTGGVHRFLVMTALQQRYKELEELEKLDKDAQRFVGEKFTYALTDVAEDSKLLAKVWADSLEEINFSFENVSERIGQLLKARGVAHEKVGRAAEMAGLPQISPEEEAVLGENLEQRYGKEAFRYIRAELEREGSLGAEQLEKEAQRLYENMLRIWKDQAVMAEQLSRVSESIKTVPGQRAYLTQAFPDFSKAASETTKSQEELVEQQKNTMELIQEWHEKQMKAPTQKIDDLREVVRTYEVPKTTAGEDFEKVLTEVVDESTVAINEAIIKRTREALKHLESKAAGKTTKEVPLYEVFRASALEAGGLYGGGGAQEEAILRQMLGLSEPKMILEATGFKGSAIHRKKQREFLEKHPTAQIEKPVEDMENRITGHIDVLYEEAGQRIVADIKTIYSSRKFTRLKQISEEIKKGKITIQDKLEQLKAASKPETEIIRVLENYLSQVNVYLKNVEGAVGEIVIVSQQDMGEEDIVIPIGEFDPKRFARDIEMVEKARAKVAKIISTIDLGLGLPKELEDYPQLYKDLTSKLEQVGAGRFVETLPKRPIGEVEASAKEVLGRLTEAEEKQYARLSKDYLAIFEALGGPGRAEPRYRQMFAGAGAAAPPGAPPGVPPGGFGGGFDDDDEFRNRIEAILAKIRAGGEPSGREAVAIVKALEEEIPDRVAAARESNDELADSLEALAETIKKTLGEYGEDLTLYKKLAELYKTFSATMEPGAAAFGKYRIRDIETFRPERPEAIHQNLKALYDVAVRVNRLADPKETDKFTPEIVALLTETAEKGPRDMSKKISEEISRLAPEQRGIMPKIWLFYKKAVSDYFINRLDTLSDFIKKETGTPEAQRAYLEYEQVVESYLANIRGTIGRMSDIFTTKGPSGKKTQFVDPELAKLTGIYKTPKQIEEAVQQSTMLPKKFQPIMDVLVGDLDVAALKEIAPPIEKARMAFQMLTEEDKDLKAILADMELFKRIGAEAVDAWDFESLVQGITQLRAAMQSYNRLQIGGFGGLGENYTEAIRKNVEDTIGYLKQLEKMFAPIGAKASPMGLVGVPPFLDPSVQELITRRNIVKAREAFAKPEVEGGLPVGRAFTLRQKIVDPASKQVLSDISVEFRKIGETTNAAGKQVGLFTEKTEDLVKSFQSKRGIGQAFGRVIRWGVASRTIYGVINALQGMIDTISDVETGMAVLRQVMNPLLTNFEEVTDAAVNFAKEFGLPIRQVIDSMRVFAQQGLMQSEVIDRTRTSMLAANVTTLTTTDATEAITAAMKVYGQEGQSTVRFLDAWSEVEARHAITSADLANALKKSAAVAKTSGVTFDELNGIIAGIGETSRQTGKEIGTSLRFIFRRLTSQKAPKELAKIGVPVIAETGELRSGFEILNDLAGAWETLNSAQKLNIATAIGGRRHYNSLIILMDHWKDALETSVHSVNSKGAAERRNFIVMDTYAKKIQQVRGAITELQVQFGKFALPVAKGLIDSFRFLIETIANIPPGIKIAALAIAGLFVALAKGGNILDSIINRVKSFGGIFGDFTSMLSKQFKIGIFEAFGKLPKGLADINVRGLSTLTDTSKGMEDFESVIGKTAFALAKFGRGWNSVMSEIALTGTATAETIGKVFGAVAGGLGGLALKTVTKQPAFAAVIEAMATGAKAGEGGFNKLAKLFGIPAEALAKWSLENTSFIKSVGPLAGSIAALVPVTGVVGDQLKKLALSADQYERSLSPLRRQLTGQLAEINDLSGGYKKLEDRVGRANKAQTPEVTREAVKAGTFKSPVLEMAKTSKDATDLANALAKTNINLVESFDEFGNAILKPTDNLKNYLEVLRQAKIKEIAESEVTALEKFANELTNAGTASSRFRSELKKFVKEIPALGPILAKQIKVSPAQELKEARDEINKILTAKAEFPFSTAFDTLFSKATQNLEELRSRFNGFVGDFRRILKDLDTRGLSATQIKGLLDREELQAAFELMAKMEKRLKRLNQTGQLDWEDILGIEILKRIQAKPVYLDYAAPLTKAMFREAGIIQRSGKSFVGDVMLFTEQLPEQFKIAGKQGILKFRDDIGFFVEAIDKEFRTVKEIPFESVKNFVDAAFPVQRIIDEAEIRLDILEESLTGAAAGMIGITDKEFKRSFTLGARFFEQIPTTTLLQTQQGFNVGTRTFGPLPEKENLPNIMKEFFLEPQKELARLIEEPKKRLLAGEPIGKGVEEAIQRLFTVIQNNQVVIQYEALMVDLNKTFAESTRTLSENIAAERARNEILIETAGLLAGLPESFSDINLGIRDFFELTAQQRLLRREAALPPEQRRFTNLRAQVTQATLGRQAAADELERIARARVQLRTITAQAVGTGVIASPQDLKSITEAVEAGATVQQGVDLVVQKDIRSGIYEIARNTEDLLVAQKDPGAISRAEERAFGNIAKIEDRLVAGLEKSNAKFVKRQFIALERLRTVSVKKGNEGVVKEVNRVLTKSTRDVLAKVGVREAGLRYLPSTNLPDLISKALPGEGLTQFMQRFEKIGKDFTEAQLKEIDFIRTTQLPRYAPAPRFERVSGSPEFKALKAAIEDQTQIDVTTSKNLIKYFTAYGAFSDIQRRAARREQRGFEAEERTLRKQQAVVVERRRAGEISPEGFQSQLQDFAKQIAEVRKGRAGAAATAEKRATQEAIGFIAGASTAFVRSMGLSEKAISFFGKSAAATIIAWNALTALTGEEMPEAIKKGTDALSKMAEKMSKEGVGLFDKVLFSIGEATGAGLGAAGKAGVAASDIKDLNKTQKDIFNQEEKDKILQLKGLQISEEQVKKTGDALKNVKDGDAKKIADADKMVNINKDQLTTLLVIEENTRKGANASEKAPEEGEIKKPVDSMKQTLGKKLDELKRARLATGGDAFTKLKDVLAGLLVVTTAGFVGEKTRTAAELGEAKRRAERVEKSFLALLKAFPEEVDMIFKKLKVKMDAAAKAAGKAPDEVGRKSLLLRQGEALENAMKQLDKYTLQFTGEADAFNKKIGAAKDQMYLEAAAEDIAGQVYAFGRTIIDASIDLETELKHRVQLTGALAGQPQFEELQFGKLEAELTPTERLFKEGGKQFQDLYIAFKNIHNIRDGIIDLMKANAKQVVTSQVNFAAETLGISKTIEKARSKAEQAAERIKAIETVEAPKEILGGGPIFGPGEGPIFEGAGPIFKEGFITDEDKETIRKRFQENVDEFNEVLDPSIITKRIEKDIASKRAELKRVQDTFREIARSRIEGLISEDVFAAVTPKFKGRAATVRQEIADLQKSGEKIERTGLGKAMDELAEKARKAAIEASAQGEFNKALEETASELNKTLMVLGQAFSEVGLSMATVVTDVDRLKDSFKDARIQREFQNIIDDMLSQLRGGAAPEAPIYPTFEMLEAGMPMEQLLNMTRAQGRIAAIVGRTGRAPTLGERQRITYEEEFLPEWRKKQTREDEKLGDQFRLAADINMAVARIQKRAVNIDDPKTRGELVGVFDKIRSDLKEAIPKAGEIVGTRKTEEGFTVNIRRGINFEEILRPLGEEFKQFVTTLSENVRKELGLTDLTDPTQFLANLKVLGSEPVVDALNQSNEFLKEIRDNTAIQTTTVFGQIKRILSRVGTEPAEPRAVGKEVGGTITGPGGPREDRVPILASPGEFIIKASSANRLGTPDLNYMNKTGRLPGFQEGGEVPEWGRKSPNLYAMAETLSNMFVKPAMAANEYLGEVLTRGAGQVMGALNAPPAFIWGSLTAKHMEGETLTESALKSAKAGFSSTWRSMTKKGDWGTEWKEYYTQVTGKSVEKAMEEFFIKQSWIPDPQRLAKDLAPAVETAVPVMTDPLVPLRVPKMLQVIGKVLKGSAGKLLWPLISKGEGLGEDVVKLIAKHKVPGKIVDILSGAKKLPAVKAPLTARQIVSEQAKFRKGQIGLGMGQWESNRAIRERMIAKFGKEKVEAVMGPDFAEALYKMDVPRLDYVATRPVATPQQLVERAVLDKVTAKKGLLKRVGLGKLAKERGSAVPGGPLQEMVESGVAGVKKLAASRQITEGRKALGMAKESNFISKAMYNDILNSPDADNIFREFGKFKGSEFKAGGHQLVSLSDQEVMKVTSVDNFKDMMSAFKATDVLSPNYVKQYDDFVVAKFRKLESVTPTEVKPRLSEIQESLSEQGFRWRKEDAIPENIGWDPKDRSYKLLDAGGIYNQGGFIQKFAGGNEVEDIYIKGLSEKMGVPYAKVQSRMRELEGLEGTGLLGWVEKRIDDLKKFFADPKVSNYMGATLTKQSMGGQIEQYAKGTPYVSNNQLAYLHKGEAVIPAEYNMGVKAGGAINALETFKDAGKEIGRVAAETIAEELAGIQVDFNIPSDADMPKLEIGNLDRLEATLENVNLGGVGAATGLTPIGQFIELATERFDRIEEQTITSLDHITVLETKSSEMDTRLNNLEDQLVFTAKDADARLAEERSYIDTRLNEVLSDFKTIEVTPLKTRVQLIELNISGLSNRIDNEHDFSMGNFNRLDLKGV